MLSVKMLSLTRRRVVLSIFMLPPPGSSPEALCFTVDVVSVCCSVPNCSDVDNKFARCCKLVEATLDSDLRPLFWRAAILGFLPILRLELTLQLTLLTVLTLALTSNLNSASPNDTLTKKPEWRLPGIADLRNYYYISRTLGTKLPDEQTDR